MLQKYGKVNNVEFFWWIKIINLNRNMYIMMKFSKYTPNI
jgi:hypothetical protein